MLFFLIPLEAKATIANEMNLIVILDEIIERQGRTTTASFDIKYYR